MGEQSLLSILGEYSRRGAREKWPPGILDRLNRVLDILSGPGHSELDAPAYVIRRMGEEGLPGPEVFESIYLMLRAMYVEKLLEGEEREELLEASRIVRRIAELVTQEKRFHP